MAEENTPASDSLLGGEGTPAEGAGEGAGEGTPAEGAGEGAGEGKPAEGEGEGKPAEGEGEGKEGDGKPVGYPADGYKDFTAPEGVALDPTAVEALAAFGKEHNLPQDAAQKVVDMGVELLSNWTKAAEQNWNETKKQWVSDSKNDKEFGGDKFNESLAGAKSALAKFGSKEFTDFLNKFGVGNHPEMIRFMYRVHQATKEDNIAPSGAQPSGQPGGMLTYPNSQHN